MTDSPFDFLNENQLLLLRLFHPVAYERTVKAIKFGTRFVHYTSANTAMRIFQNQEVWMRKSSCMNDFMEIEHGFECLNAAYKGNKEKVISILDGIFPRACEKLEHRFNSWLPHFRTNTYIACISEHGDETTGDEEDKIGRLSMWRAYGGVTGVAIVMNGGPFLRPSAALKAYTSPVAYLSVDKFEEEFHRLLDGIAENSAVLKIMGEETIVDQMFEAFRYAILCTKHPGFREEREWRVIYNHVFDKSDRLIADVQSIRGTPQPIFKIPLINIPDEGLFGIELAELIERVIIGPTQFPVAIMEALTSLLSAAKMTDASSKVFISDIPLRQFD